MEVGTIFGFSLCIVLLLVTLVIYFRKYTQDKISREVHQKVGGMSLLTPEVGNSFS